MRTTPNPGSNSLDIAPTRLPAELTVAGLVAEIRSEVARQQCLLLLPEETTQSNQGESLMADPAAANGPQLLVARPSGSRRPLVDWVQITANLKWARQWANGIGHKLPQMKRLRGLFRVLARPLAWCLLFLSRVVTHLQREFNLMTLNLLNDLANGLRGVEHGQRSVVNHLENDIERRLRELENTVERLKAQLSQPEAGERAA